MIKDFVDLTKPGIITGNLVACIGGFLLASKGGINFPLLAFTLLAMAAVIGSACVFNNIYDQDIDALMKRTSKRPLVDNRLSNSSAFIWGMLLAIIGFSLFYLLVNPLTALIAGIGFIVYVFIYSMWTKRHSIWATEMGSISGACPPVAGYVAVSNELDMAAWCIFAIMCFWQMPHSYAIGFMRMNDFTTANIPVYSVVRNFEQSKLRIIFYQIVFLLALISLYCFDYVGEWYLVIMLAVSLYWLLLSFKRQSFKTNAMWAKKLFLWSLIIVMAFSFLISIDYRI